MGFWHIYMGIYGGGSGSVVVVAGVYAKLVGDQGRYTAIVGDQERYTALVSDTNDS